MDNDGCRHYQRNSVFYCALSWVKKDCPRLCNLCSGKICFSCYGKRLEAFVMDSAPLFFNHIFFFGLLYSPVNSLCMRFKVLFYFSWWLDPLDIIWYYDTTSSHNPGFNVGMTTAWNHNNVFWLTKNLFPSLRGFWNIINLQLLQEQRLVQEKQLHQVDL